MPTTTARNVCVAWLSATHNIPKPVVAKTSMRAVSHTKTRRSIQSGGFPACAPTWLSATKKYCGTSPPSTPRGAAGDFTSNARRAMLTLKVDGYVEAKRIMDQLPNNMQKRMLFTALRTSAQPMLRTAKGRVPVRTGRLRRQLRIVRFRDRNAPRPEVDVAVKPVFERTKRKGSVNQYYGKFIHEGTKDPRTSRKGRLLVFENERGEKIFTRSVRGLRAVPFLEIAYSQESERTVALFGDALAAAVEKFVVRNFKAVSP